MPATKGTAKLTAQDANAMRTIIAEMESQVCTLRRLADEGFKSDGISNNASDLSDRVYLDPYNRTRYNVLSGLKSERLDADGNSVCVSGATVDTAAEHLDAILTELYDGTYPGFQAPSAEPASAQHGNTCPCEDCEMHNKDLAFHGESGDGWDDEHDDLDGADVWQ